jgi:hypothetical protein
MFLQGDEGYCYIPYRYLIDKRLVSTTDAFWAIADIVSRAIRRRGYVSYPNFNEYHRQVMLSTNELKYQNNDCVVGDEH